MLFHLHQPSSSTDTLDKILNGGLVAVFTGPEKERIPVQLWVGQGCFMDVSRRGFLGMESATARGGRGRLLLVS